MPFNASTSCRRLYGCIQVNDCGSISVPSSGLSQCLCFSGGRIYQHNRVTTVGWTRPSLVPADTGGRFLAVSIANQKASMNLSNSFRQLLLRPTYSKHIFAFYLKAVKPFPHENVDFQLWVANQDEPEIDVHRGMVNALYSDSCPFLLQVSLCESFLCSDANKIFKHQQDGWGFIHFIPRHIALDPAAGFLKDDHMIVGVHISLWVTQVVICTGPCTCTELRHQGSATSMCCNCRLIYLHSKDGIPSC